MFKIWKYTLILVIAVMLSYCTLGQKYDTLFKDPPQSNNLQTEYLICYYDDEGIKVKNTIHNQDSLLISLTQYHVTHKLSPDSMKIAISFSQHDSIKLVVYEIKTGSIWPIITLPCNFDKIEQMYFMSYAWAPDGQQLGIGYYTLDNRSVEARPKDGDIIVTSYSGSEQHSVGCSKAKIIEHWLSDTTIVVSDRDNMYIVNLDDCKTIKRIPLKDKKQLKFSSNSSHYMFYSSLPVFSYQENRTIKYDELYVAEIGGKTKKVIPFSAHPRKASWSPDGSKIVLDVQSKEWSNIREIVMYHIESGDIYKINDSDILGLPSCDNAHWSPDGTRLLYDRSFARGNYQMEWQVLQAVIRNLDDYSIKIISSGQLNTTYWTITPWTGRSETWIDIDNVLLASREGSIIFNISTELENRLEQDNLHIIHIKPNSLENQILSP